MQSLNSKLENSKSISLIIPVVITCSRPNESNHYKIEALNLFLGVWQGTKNNRTGYWLRWWDETGQLLPWGIELVEQERQRAEQERQRAEVLIAQLRAAGIEPNL